MGSGGEMEKKRKDLADAVEHAIKATISRLNEAKNISVPELIRLLELQRELQREDVKFVTATWIEPEN